MKGQGHESQKTVVAWVFALFWGLASSSYKLLRLCQWKNSKNRSVFGDFI